jgi:hypothetical protein
VRRALVLIGLLLLPGCVFRETSLPTAKALLHWSSIELRPAAYCWDFGGRAQCADSAGPEHLLATGDLKPVRTAGGFDTQIQFTTSSPLQRFRVDLAYGPGGPTSMPAGSDQTFPIEAAPPAKTGVYVYAITGGWREGDVTYFLALDLAPGVA